MSNITVITAPDHLLNNVLSILLVEPSNLIKQELNKMLSVIDKEVNLYFYDGDNVEWLLKTIKIADITIVDLDNSSPLTKVFSSYIISQPKTFYLTNDNFTPYNIISKNRIYDLSWLDIVLKEE